MCFFYTHTHIYKQAKVFLKHFICKCTELHPVLNAKFRHVPQLLLLCGSAVLFLKGSALRKEEKASGGAASY